MSDSWEHYPGMTDAGRRLGRLANSVAERPARIRMLPIEEQMAVALVLNWRGLFLDGEFTILQAVEHLGPERLKTGILVEKALCHCPDDD